MSGRESEGVAAAALLRLPVRVRGIRLGRPVDLVLDVPALRVVGIEVACGDESLRFLPLAAARVRDDEIAVGSALLLLEEGDLSFYRRRGRLLSALRDSDVVRDGRRLGALRDVVVGRDGEVVALEVDVPAGSGLERRRVRADATVTLAPRGRASAA